jgi:hypothetical protein
LRFVLPAAVAAEEAHPSAHFPVEQQLAFMTEHVEAGMAFYKQGKLDMVAPHLLHPVSKTHSLECVGLEKFDFNSAIFLEVSTEIKSLLR